MSTNQKVITAEGNNSYAAARSNQMDLLYGEERSKLVYQRLQYLDPILNEEIQRIAYDHYWARPGLSFEDKSLVTVISLIALNKEEQTRIHIHGLLERGVPLKELAEIIIYAKEVVSEESAQKAIIAAIDVLKERALPTFNIEEFKRHIESKNISLTERRKCVINIALASAIGNNDITRDTIGTLLEQGFDVKDMKNIFIHQIVYCGFPTSMTSFAILQDVLSARNQLRPRL